MTIYTTITINGTEYDFDSLKVDRSLNENNGASSFTATMPNKFGTFADEFVLNSDVLIKAGTSPNPTEVIFGGILEDIRQDGEGTREMLTLSGRDYSALMQDVTVRPIVYRDSEISDIVKSIIEQNIPAITTNNVQTTGETLERSAYSHDNVFDAISLLAKTAGFYFYVDEDKDLHFEQRDTVSSGYTFDNTNITKGDITIQDRDIYNVVWVYGTRVMTAANDQFTADGTGSVFTLSDKPHQTSVFNNDVLQQPGGVEGIDDPFNKNVVYLVDFDKKEIVFTSGNAAGDNVPVSGDFISVDYFKSTPIIRRRQNSDSINQYGKKVKVISEDKISSFAQASSLASTFLAENKDPVIQANLDVDGWFNVIPGQTAIINAPNQGVENQSYRIVQASYNFDGTSVQTGDVLNLRMNKKVDDVTDTIKELIIRLGAVERGQLDTNITNYEESTGSIIVQDHWEAYSFSGTNHAFKFHLEGQNQLNSPGAVLGPWELGSTLIGSGGDF